MSRKDRFSIADANSAIVLLLEVFHILLSSAGRGLVEQLEWKVRFPFRIFLPYASAVLGARVARYQGLRSS